MSVVYLPCANWKAEPDRVLVIGKLESLLDQIRSYSSGGDSSDRRPSSWLATQLSPPLDDDSSSSHRPLTRVSARPNLHRRRSSSARTNFMSWISGDFDAANLFSAPVPPGGGGGGAGGGGAALRRPKKRSADGTAKPASAAASGAETGGGGGGGDGGPIRPVVEATSLLDMARSLRPTIDDPDTVEGTFRYSNGRTFRLRLAALPTSEPSRHDCPARPHAVTDVVKGFRAKNGSGHLAVLLVLEREEDAFAVGCAVARAFPLYSRKGGKSTGLPRGIAAGSDLAIAPNGGSDGAKAEVKGTATAAAAAAAAASVVMSRGLGSPTDSIEYSEDDIDDLLHASAGIQLASRLVDAPPNEMHVDAFVEEAKAVARILNGGEEEEDDGDGKFQVTVDVVRGEELRKRGMNGIYSVGKAAVHPPALVVLTYNPRRGSSNNNNNDSAAKNIGGIAWVGKGITYDTGGLSLKGKEGMPGMKRDMGGAACVLAAFEAAVQCAESFLSGGGVCGSKAPKALHAVLCLAENAIGPNAFRNDDILTLYSGKTVEINNTDAEGRLVLADGVSYAASDLGAEMIVDVATLTGAQGIATGRRIGAAYANHADLERFAVDAGRRSGDLVHPVPYVPSFARSEFKSAVADMKNSVKDRSNMQVSCAAQFVGEHLPEGFEEGNAKGKRWLHVDMASPAYDKSDERASGFGVAFLLELLRGPKKRARSSGGA